MSDQTDDSVQTEALEAQVAELLDEIDRKAEAVESRLGGEDDSDAAAQEILSELGDDVDDAPADSARATPDDPEGDLDQDVEALIEKAERLSEEAVGGGDRAERGPTEEDEEIGALIDSVTSGEGEGGGTRLKAADAGSGGDGSPSNEEPLRMAGEVVDPTDDEADTDGDGASLDDALAAEADDAISHEVAGEIETVDLEEALETRDAIEAEAESAPTVVEEVSDEAEAESASGVVEAENETADEGEASTSFGARLLAVLTAVGRLMSKPLERLSPRARDTLGWIALNALFLAACVWLFTLLR